MSIALHIARMYWEVFWSAFGAFRITGYWLKCVIAIPALGLVNHVGMFLDRLRFPGFQSVSVDRPLFIMGHPRSGTTLLHQALTRHSSVMSFKTWEVFFPALIWRRPLCLLFGLKGRTVVPSETGHLVTWDGVEEEELLFLHLLDTQMASLLTPLGFSRADLSVLCFSDSQPHTRTSARFLKRCFQRQMWWTDRKIVIARMNYSLTRMNALRAVFPNAKFILIYREPIQAIASHLSLHRALFVRRYGMRVVHSEAWRRYIDRRYRWSCHVYRRMASELTSNGTNDCEVIAYDEVIANVDHVVRRVFHCAGIECDAQSERIAQDASEAQARYRPNHHNLPLSAFGLSADQIRSDLGDTIEEIANALSRRDIN